MIDLTKLTVTSSLIDSHISAYYSDGWPDTYSDEGAAMCDFVDRMVADAPRTKLEHGKMLAMLKEIAADAFSMGHGIRASALIAEIEEPQAVYGVKIQTAERPNRPVEGAAG